MKKNIKRICILLVCFPIFILVLANYSVKNAAKDKTYFSADLIKKNKVGLVLGTSKYLKGGNINLYFAYRIKAAVELYEKNKIDFILVSGDNATMHYNEPIEFKKELIKNGIPEEKIFLDYAGFRTLASVIRAKKIFNQDNITIISQKFHNERAIYLATHHQIHAIGFNAKDVPAKYGFKIQIREYFARTKAFFDVIFGIKPKFLGKKIEIK